MWFRASRVPIHRRHNLVFSSRVSCAFYPRPRWSAPPPLWPSYTSAPPTTAAPPHIAIHLLSLCPSVSNTCTVPAFAPPRPRAPDHRPRARRLCSSTTLPSLPRFAPALAPAPAPRPDLQHSDGGRTTPRHTSPHPNHHSCRHRLLNDSGSDHRSRRHAPSPTAARPRPRRALAVRS
ncbi:hypothetical protein B0H11DRAFT_36540 [Mycena galericulata]|nr:hypothetical protein B0H11DRAFT_36540 [Mycena galericulata]